MTLPKHVRSGVMANASCAPPQPSRNPVITSSKIKMAPTRSHSERSPARKPSTGWTRPMLAATGSTMTHATVSSSSGTSL